MFHPTAKAALALCRNVALCRPHGGTSVLENRCGRHRHMFALFCLRKKTFAIRNAALSARLGQPPEKPENESYWGLSLIFTLRCWPPERIRGSPSYRAASCPPAVAITWTGLLGTVNRKYPVLSAKTSTKALGR
jgi:hypothetical protein